jgi:hypothetical protein
MMEIVERIRADKDSHYLSWSQEDEGKVSYASSTAQKYDTKHRTKTTLSRYLRRRMKLSAETVPDAELAKIAGYIFGALSDSDKHIEVIYGEDIVDAYRDHFGQSSCMTGGCSEYVQIYADNPDKIGLIKYTNGIDARAVLWLTDEGKVVMDRIYPCDGYHIDALVKWAEKNDIICRTHHSIRSRHDGDGVMSDGQDHDVTLRQSDTDVWPYMDSFMYATLVRGNKVKVSTTASGGYDHCLDFTDGTIDGSGDWYYCAHCEERVHPDEAFTTEDDTYCESCYGLYFTSCEHCEESTARDDIAEVYNSSGHRIEVCSCCAESDYAECYECGDIHHADALETVDDECYCESCVPETEEVDN